jgi:hypothetical protein
MRDKGEKKFSRSSMKDFLVLCGSFGLLLCFYFYFLGLLSKYNFLISL